MICPASLSVFEAAQNARIRVAPVLIVPVSMTAGAVKARTQAGNQLRDLILTAPEPLRQHLAGLPAKRQADAAARFRPGDPACPAEGTKAAMASVAAATSS